MPFGTKKFTTSFASFIASLPSGLATGVTHPVLASRPSGRVTARFTTRRFWTKVLATVAPPLLALGGCSINGGSGLSPVEARTALYEALDDTQDVAGGLWENRDDPTARGCVIPLWVEGEKYPGLRIGTAPSNVDGALKRVVDAWSEWGYRVETTLVGDVNELQGRNSLDELLIFRVTEDAMTLQGESECRPEA